MDIDTITVGPVSYADFQTRFASKPGLLNAGIRVQVNPMFPYTQPCSDCHGTGVDQQDQADCRKCRATGGTRIIGMGTGRGVFMLTANLPRKFAPRFPLGLVRPPLLCRGLP